MFYSCCRFFLAVLCYSLFKLKVKGRECIPKQGGFILASNHASNLDPVVLAVASVRHLKFLAKEELFAIPIFSNIIRALGAIPLKRYTGDISTIRAAIKLLRQGNPLLIFPQGTRSDNFEQALPGVGYLIYKSKVPLICAKIEGTDKVLPRGKKFFSLHPIKVTLKKIDLSEDDRKNYKQLSKKVLTIIKNL